jgi:diguanylate cyclase (GGDEF)-like protein
VPCAASGKFEPLIAFVRCWLGRLIVALVLAGLPLAAGATTLRIDKPLCHAVTAGEPPASAAAYSCNGAPTAYQQGTLWLHADLSQLDAARDAPVLLVHHSRFDRLIVLFHYADGMTDRQQVVRGDYGAHWRIGGQIAFEAPRRDAVPAGVTLGFEHLASHALLRIRILPRDGANRDLATAAVLAGGSITLLLIGGIYNLSLAIAVRRQFLAWHGVWAICMVLWGLFWSQIMLIALPGVAGTTVSQTCTLLACLAVTTATLSVVSALESTLPRWLRRTAAAIGIMVGLVGIPASLVTDKSLDTLGMLLNVLVLADLAAASLCIGWGWRRGSNEARDLARSWSVPMAMLAFTQIFDFNDTLFGGGAQIAVLSASALQTVWLSITTTLRLSQMRVELDQARAAESALAELASRDPLTGLLNRRGFVDCLHQTFIGGNDAPLALLLMDVDLFKGVNDQFGHEAGDAVLCRIADCLRRLEREVCIAGRMGGEEFVLAVSGLSSFALAQFAERVRDTIGRCDHGDVSKHRAVTVSIGVAEGSTRTSFQKLYGAADRALYEAKRAGRNRVMFHQGTLDLQLREELERDQLSFRWPKLRG